jgi:hypothetical protein
MKNLLFLFVCAGLIGTAGCVETVATADPPTYYTGTFEFCDDWGCRYITAPHYYANGIVIYWDAHFGYWVGPHGYLVGGRWHQGFVPGYHGWYGAGFYHCGPGCYHGNHPGSYGYHGGYHGGGGHGGGAHGGGGHR